jgi:hypothetical protein
LGVYNKEPTQSLSKGEQGTLLLTPESMVHDTTLVKSSFQLVTPYVALHFHAESDEEREDWTTAMLRVIYSSLEYDHIPQVVRSHAYDIASDPSHFYEVVYDEKRPLGMALKPVGEWAVVSAVKPHAGMFVSSYLVAIQGESVVLTPYREVIQMLSSWEPPLTLRFRRQPSLSGYLYKQCSGRMFKSWVEHRVCLKNGVLHYQRLDGRRASQGTENLPMSVDAAGFDTKHPRFQLELEGACMRVVQGSSRRGSSSGGNSSGGSGSRSSDVWQTATKNGTESNGGRPSSNGSSSGSISRRSSLGSSKSDNSRCFAVVSGTEKLVLQAKDRETLVEWCGAIHYALAMTNGGGFLLQQEEEARTSYSIDIKPGSVGSMGSMDSVDSVGSVGSVGGRTDSTDSMAESIDPALRNDDQQYANGRNTDHSTTMHAVPPAAPSPVLPDGFTNLLRSISDSKAAAEGSPQANKKSQASSPRSTQSAGAYSAQVDDEDDIPAIRARAKSKTLV